VVPLKIVEVINGDIGWYQINEGERVALSKAELGARKQREHHVEVFLGAESFDPGTWHCSEPKSGHVRGEDVWMFEATAKGVEPLTLYFGKESGLLVRLKTRATDFAWLPGEKPKIESFTRDLHFRNWRKFGAHMLPGFLQSFHDGVLWQQMEPVNVSLLKT